MPGLAIGLAVGIPSFLALSLLAVLQIRHRKREKMETNTDDEIDIGLRDDSSYRNFEDELQRTAGSNEKTTSAAASSNEKASSNSATPPLRSKPLMVHSDLEQASSSKSLTANESLDQRIDLVSSQNSKLDDKEVSSASTQPVSTPSQIQTVSYSETSDGQTLPTSLHSGLVLRRANTRLAYDFYDTMLPIVSSDNRTSIGLSQIPTIDGLDSRTTTDSTSLDNLARQLATPSIFEKVPSRVPTISGRSYLAPLTRNNSQSDFRLMLGNSSTTINEHYVFERSNTNNTAQNGNAQRTLPAADAPHRHARESDGIFLDTEKKL